MFKNAFLFVIEPNAPPADVTGHNTSSKSIFVDWDDVPAPDQNGIILRYTVTYTTLPNGSPVSQVVTAPSTQATLTGLNEYTNYSITVFASTSKGNGNVSRPIIVVTDEDSKLTCALFLNLWQQEIYVGHSYTYYMYLQLYVL